MKKQLFFLKTIFLCIQLLSLCQVYSSPNNVKSPQNINLEQQSDSTELDSSLQDLKVQSALAEIEERTQNSNEEVIEDEEKIELHLENTDLQNFVTQIAQLFDVTFIPDDIVEPLLAGKKAIKGNKISFRSYKPLSKKEIWNFFLTALDLAGLAIIPDVLPRFYKITKTEDARKSAIPAFIGVDPETLPNSDQLIRYVYFIENGSLDTIKNVIESLRSSASSFFIINDLKAFVLTDKSHNIKHLMKIVTEFDKTTPPQAMSVLQLVQANADDVKKLYDSITQTDDKSITSRLFPARKKPTALYFPETTRIIAETRTNSLILLGPQIDIEKIEEFIKKHVDVSLEKPYSPLHIHNLKFADASTVASIMNELVKFGSTTPAGKSGGVRGYDKYLQPMSFIAEKETNQLIVHAHKEDYLQVKDVIDTLDEQQPQVAVEILILTVGLRNNKKLGTQLRSKDKTVESNKQAGTDGIFGTNVKFQTSGLCTGGTAQGIKTNSEGTGINRLLTDLIGLATGASAGNTIVTLGNDMLGVWGIFNALETVANTQVVATPFLVATNKKQAEVSIGETRRVVSSTVISGSTETPSFTNKAANLRVIVTPQINSDGMIALDLDITIDSFTDADRASATVNNRNIKTSTIVADGQILALGGLIQNKTDTGASKVPLLGNIPVFGWLFKNKRKEEAKDNLLILISTHIIKPDEEQDVLEFTQSKIKDYQGTIDEMSEIAEQRDPIHNIFFEKKEDMSDRIVDDFLSKNKKQRKKQRRNKKKHQEQMQKPATAVQSKTKVEEPSKKDPLPIKKNKQSLTDLLSHNNKGAKT